MNRTNNKKSASLAVHPELRRILLANPTHESLGTIIEYQLFDQPSPPLADDILCLLPYWEQQACEGLSLNIYLPSSLYPYAFSR